MTLKEMHALRRGQNNDQRETKCIEQEIQEEISYLFDLVAKVEMERLCKIINSVFPSIKLVEEVSMETARRRWYNNAQKWIRRSFSPADGSRNSYVQSIMEFISSIPDDYSYAQIHARFVDEAKVYPDLDNLLSLSQIGSISGYNIERI